MVHVGDHRKQLLVIHSEPRSADLQAPQIVDCKFNQKVNLHLTLIIDRVIPCREQLIHASVLCFHFQMLLFFTTYRLDTNH